MENDSALDRAEAALRDLLAKIPGLRFRILRSVEALHDPSLVKRNFETINVKIIGADIPALRAMTDFSSWDDSAIDSSLQPK